MMDLQKACQGAEYTLLLRDRQRRVLKSAHDRNVAVSVDGGHMVPGKDHLIMAERAYQKALIKANTFRQAMGRSQWVAHPDAKKMRNIRASKAKKAAKA